MNKPAKTTAVPSDAPARPSSEALLIVGIGASAGGLEALEQFLSHVPKDSGLAFVIVQHLDPTHKGILPELLQRRTPMVVEQIKDRQPVRPNCVYVIPPNKDLSLLRGALHLFEPGATRGLRLPIDFFFRSLAEDQKERSVGIILSGMGSDGTLGLRAIKEMAGVALVQEPATAKFDAMPRSAIDAGLADIVAPAEALCQRLLAYLQHPSPAISAEPALDEHDPSGLDKVVILLRTHTGHDFSLYKKNALHRRIERRMRLHQLDKIAHYVRLLQDNPQERELLFKELLIGVTRFFRDPPAWVQLRNQILPQLLAQHPEGGVLRAWVAGCATGEEAFSLGIAFKETLAQLCPPKAYTLQIFATDLDADAIAKARQGLYPENITADVAPEQLQRFFVHEENGGYRIGRDVRELVTFAPQNLVQDPPFTKLDLLLCRNLLIYLTPELQKKLLTLFHYSLNPGGVLFLGSAETVGNPSDLFVPLEGKWRFYQRQARAAPVQPADFPAWLTPAAAGESPTETRAAPAPASLQAQADQVLLQRFAPAAVLSNGQGDILYINGRTGKYLEPAAGKANWNLFAMAREGLRECLLSNCQQALRLQPSTAVIQRGLRVKTNGDYQTVDLTVQMLGEPAALRGLLMVVFADAPPAGKRRGKAGQATASLSRDQLEEERQKLRQELAFMHEDMQISQEELKSTNEELQSTNEELQSTNEELTTSKEEMQSLNEELQTVNAELQINVRDLTRTSDDMKNLLNSTDIATLFLDGALHVRRFTIQASKLIKLIPGDIGRPITDIASDLLYPTLGADVTEVLQTLVFVEKSVATQDGRWFNLRIMPYRTMDNRIDGVVITLVDISWPKKLEMELRQAREELAARRAGKDWLPPEAPPGGW